MDNLTFDAKKKKKYAFFRKHNPIVVFHVNHTNKPTHIYVFGAEKNNETEESLFSKAELDAIRIMSIKIAYFPDQRIYTDDTIDTIKRKIAIALDSFLYEELYLFVQKQISYMSIEETHSKLLETSKSHSTISKQTFKQFLKNINLSSPTFLNTESETQKIHPSILPYIHALKTDQNKYKEYIEKPDRIQHFLSYIHKLTQNTSSSIPSSSSFTQLFNLPLSNHIHSISAFYYTFYTNPFDIQTQDEVELCKTHESDIITNNKKLYMDYEHTFKNRLFLCTFSSFLNHPNSSIYNNSSFIHTFFPFLYDLHIHNFQQFKSKKKHIAIQNQYANRNITSIMKNIHYMHDAYEKYHQQLPILQDGASYVMFYIHPLMEINLPLHDIFKRIMTNEYTPFIKFTPNYKSERLYKLLTNGISTSGKSIPTMPMNNVNKISKVIGRQRCIATYGKLNKFTIICEILQNGSLICKMTADKKECRTLFEYENTIQIYKSMLLRPIIDEFMIDDSKVFNFDGLNTKNIEIVDIHYKWQFQKQHTFQIQKATQLLFDVYSFIKNKENVHSMKYKRVSDFNEVASIDAFIIHLINQGNLDKANILNAVMNTYPNNITENEALAKYHNLVLQSEFQMNSKFINKKLHISKNPGFLLTFKSSILKIQDHLNIKEPPKIIENGIEVEMQNITNIRYIYTAMHYIHTTVLAACIPDVLNDLKKNIVKVNKIELKEDIQEKVKSETDSFVAASNANIDIKSIVEKQKQYELDLESKNTDGTIAANQAVDKNRDSPVSNEDTRTRIDQEENNDISKKYDMLYDMLGVEKESDESVVPDNLKKLSDKDEPASSSESRSSSASSKSNDYQGIFEMFGGNPSLFVTRSDSNHGSLYDSYSRFDSENFLPDHILLTDKELTEYIGGAKKKPENDTYTDNNAESDEDDDEKYNDTIKMKKNKDTDENDSQDILNIFKNNSNPFLYKLKHLDPDVFNDTTNPEKTYPKSCQWNYKRHPIILTDAEKKEIDKKDAKSYGNTFKYRNYWYICPRYWSFKHKRPLTEEDVKSGKYGKILPSDIAKIAKRKNAKLDPNENIFEFTDNVKHTKDGKYVKFHPGFVQRDAHPKKMCMPCCVKLWNTPEQESRRKECAQTQDNDNDNDNDTNTKKIEDNEKQLVYILDSDKTHLNENRYAYLPMQMLQLLKVTYKNKKKLGLLRYGVEYNERLSFIGAIAYYFGNLLKNERISIKEMSKTISEVITLDIFVNAHNGNLVNIFLPKKEKYESYADLDDVYNKKNEFLINTHKSSVTYAKLMHTQVKENMYMFLTMCVSFVEFKRYLYDENVMEPSVVVDHRYLWDIICTPNPKLFTRGINLVIFSTDNDDITKNIRIICPSNHYATKFFEENKPTIFMYKYNEFYQPIVEVPIKYEINRVTSVLNINKFFDKNHEIIKKIEPILRLIEEQCKPLKSLLSKNYYFKRNKKADVILNMVRRLGYEIKKQYVNHNGKTIGFLLYSLDDKDEGFVPTLPSQMHIEKSGENNNGFELEDVPAEVLTYETSMEAWNTYEGTMNFLNRLHEKSNGFILCKPKVKIVQDGLIVGILTETNQFVPLKSNETNSDIYDIEEHSGYNYLELDRNTMNGDVEYDRKRVEIIKKIYLESKFYDLFKNIVRSEINAYNNIEKKDNIEKLIEDENVEYEKKLHDLVNILKNLCKNKVHFSEYDKRVIHELVLNTTCVHMEKEKCEFSLHCKYDESGGCMLMIPKKNLVNYMDNGIVYFERMADEIIRFDFTRLEILKKNELVLNKNVEYAVKDNEIIISQSLLDDGYLNNLKYAYKLSEIERYNHDMKVPFKTINYTKDENLIYDELSNSYIADMRSKETSSEKDIYYKEKAYFRKIYVSGHISEYVSTTAIELVFDNENTKSSYFLIEYAFNKKKEDMIVAYNKLPYVMHGKVLDYLYYEGKHELVKDGIENMKRMVNDGLDYSVLEKVLHNDSYYVTLCDIIVLCRDLKKNVAVYFATENPIIRSKFMYITTVMAESSKTSKPKNDTRDIVLIKANTNYRTLNQPYELRILLLDKKNIFYNKKDIPVMLANEYSKNEMSLLQYMDLFEEYKKDEEKRVRENTGDMEGQEKSNGEPWKSVAGQDNSNEGEVKSVAGQEKSNANKKTTKKLKLKLKKVKVG